jgi:5-methylcytosine-specific restriction endonuclease McrA
MIDIALINDPEYRWNHKEEMSRITPYYSERKKYGMDVLNYETLRYENQLKIKPDVKRRFDWDIFKSVIDMVPNNLDKTKKKQGLEPRDRLHFEMRDMGECHICGQINKYGYYGNGYRVSQLHHIIPNGRTTNENIITLCLHCHQSVHQILYLLGKWGFAKPL